jgi:hypothetical protein
MAQFATEGSEERFASFRRHDRFDCPERPGSLRGVDARDRAEAQRGELVPGSNRFSGYPGRGVRRRRQQAGRSAEGVRGRGNKQENPR